MFVNDLFGGANEDQQRLDPKCWKGYKKQGTKIKGGVRVNNCVPANEESADAGISKDKETKFHAKLDRLVHDTFGKRDDEMKEAGPFSYGKPTRKGSIADLAAKKRKEQERGKQPIEPRDQQVGVARVTKGVAEEKKGLYYYVNKRKAAGTSRPASHPKAPTAQAWRDAAKTAKKESVDKEYELQVRLMEMRMAGYQV